MHRAGRGPVAAAATQRQPQPARQPGNSTLLLHRYPTRKFFVVVLFVSVLHLHRYPTRKFFVFCFLFVSVLHLHRYPTRKFCFCFFVCFCTPSSSVPHT